MELDLKDIAQKLISELNMKELIYKARAEGVAMMYDRIRAASETPVNETSPVVPTDQKVK